MATKSKPTTKKAAARSAASKPAKAPKRAAAKAPEAEVAPGFGPPDWGNVLPPPIDLVSTGDATLDAALRVVIDGETDGDTADVAEQAPDDVLIAMFRGNALAPGQPFHDEELVARLTPAQKGKRNKAYWAAESAKNQRERVFHWFCHRLATTAAGRAHLLEVAAGALETGEHAAGNQGRVRGMAAIALRDVADDALWRAIASRLDPLDFQGTIDHTSSTYLMHAYTVGATAGLIVDPIAAHARWKPLLDPAALGSRRAELQASAVVLGIRDYIGDGGARDRPTPTRDGAALAHFTPDVIALLDVEPLQHFAMFALERLPADQRVCEVIATRFPPGTTEFGKYEIQLLARTTNPAHLPILAAALGRSWMHWSPVFRGLASIGDPRGIAVIEAWIADNDASDRRGPANDAIAAIRARAGDPTPEQRAEGVALLEAGDRKKKKKR